MSNIYNNSVVRYWQFIFHDLSDPRTRDWFLISSPVPGLSLLIGYLYFVLSWGPKNMEHRKPYKLKNILVVYNFLQILLSTWLFNEGMEAIFLHNYSLTCEPVDFSYDPYALRVCKYCLLNVLLSFFFLLFFSLQSSLLVTIDFRHLFYSM
ncbi:hypothetical protein PUN28_014551 [Cardiocondyla obscurior]|uniref:Elongation of very long chain fatty acids protein n=1 Tax=Cardiocondyla obscurior TaxID=286306 RepID=A0AAW2F0T0_9HYME